MERRTPLTGCRPLPRHNCGPAVFCGGPFLLPSATGLPSSIDNICKFEGSCGSVLFQVPCTGMLCRPQSLQGSISNFVFIVSPPFKRCHGRAGPGRRARRWYSPTPPPGGGAWCWAGGGSHFPTSPRCFGFSAPGSKQGGPESYSFSAAAPEYESR